MTFRHDFNSTVEEVPSPSHPRTLQCVPSLIHSFDEFGEYLATAYCESGALLGKSRCNYEQNRQIRLPSWNFYSSVRWRGGWGKRITIDVKTNGKRLKGNASVLPNLIYRFNPIPIRILACCFVNINKPSLKFLWHGKWLRLPSKILREKNKVVSLTPTQLHNFL